MSGSQERQGNRAGSMLIVTESGDDGLMSGLIAWANTKRK